MDAEQQIDFLLRQSGWYPSREADYSSFEYVLERIGCVIDGKSKEFLRVNFGLKFRFLRGVVDVTLTEAIRSVGLWDITAMSKLMNSPVCMVGFVTDHTMYMTPSGIVGLCSYDWAYYSEYPSTESLYLILAGFENGPPPVWIENDSRPEDYREADDVA